MPVAGQVLTQKNDPRGGAFSIANQGIHADQWLDAGALSLFVELHHREQVALIGERHGRHSGRRHRGHQLRHAYDTVEQRILGVQPQMHESTHRLESSARPTGPAADSSSSADSNSGSNSSSLAISS